MKSFVEEDSIDLHAEEESSEEIVEEKIIPSAKPAKKRIFKKKIA
jgi:hypothetical protein